MINEAWPEQGMETWMVNSSSAVVTALPVIMLAVAGNTRKNSIKFIIIVEPKRMDKYPLLDFIPFIDKALCFLKYKVAEIVAKSTDMPINM